MGMILMQRLKLVSVLGLFCLASGAWAQSRPLLLGTGGCWVRITRLVVRYAALVVRHTQKVVLFVKL